MISLILVLVIGIYDIFVHKDRNSITNGLSEVVDYYMS